MQKHLLLLAVNAISLFIFIPEFPFFPKYTQEECLQNIKILEVMEQNEEVIVVRSVQYWETITEYC